MISENPVSVPEFPNNIVSRHWHLGQNVYDLNGRLNSTQSNWGFPNRAVLTAGQPKSFGVVVMPTGQVPSGTVRKVRVATIEVEIYYSTLPQSGWSNITFPISVISQVGNATLNQTVGTSVRTTFSGNLPMTATLTDVVPVITGGQANTVDGLTGALLTAPVTASPTPQTILLPTHTDAISGSLLYNFTAGTLTGDSDHFSSQISGFSANSVPSGVGTLNFQGPVTPMTVVISLYITRFKGLFSGLPVYAVLDPLGNTADTVHDYLDLRTDHFYELISPPNSLPCRAWGVSLPRPVVVDVGEALFVTLSFDQGPGASLLVTPFIRAMIDALVT